MPARSSEGRAVARRVLFWSAAAAVAVGASASAGLTAPPRQAPLPGWTLVRTGTAGGTVWIGRIPNRHVVDNRPSAIFLPPGFNRLRRYPVVYLLHGLPGSPTSYYASLDLANVADAVIAETRRAFIAVAPVGGPRTNASSGEWAGRWEDYVVSDVVPWVDRHLPTLRHQKSRALAGLSAGGYGAMNIGLRHPRLFGTLESWGGYFAPVLHDGPFVHASPSVLAANDPTLLVEKQAALLRSLGVRFYVSVGGGHGPILRKWSLSYAALLDRLRLPHKLWLLPVSQRGHFWRATFPSALRYAAAAAGFSARHSP